MLVYKNHLLLVLMSFSAVFLLLNDIQAQSKKALDIKAIKAMEGCYDVDFKYTETFAPEIDYEKAYDYSSAAFEWAEIIEETEDKIVLQHLLIIQKDSSPAYIVKHWRQDWVYETDRNFYYSGDNKWIMHELTPEERKGTWTQNVYHVDDSPRYSGTATWTHVDGQSSWYNKTDSPLPRREYSTRDDYNIMKRGNRVKITDTGWVHEQDNDKIIRKQGKDVLLVQEKGYNTYTKRAEGDCQVAIDWWEENKEMWAMVRDEWTGIFANHKEIKLAEKIDDKRLYKHFFNPHKEWTEQSIAEIIDQYLLDEDTSQTKMDVRTQP